MSGTRCWLGGSILLYYALKCYKIKIKKYTFSTAYDRQNNQTSSISARVALISVDSDLFMDRWSLNADDSRRAAAVRGRRRAVGRRHSAVAKHRRVLARLSIVRKIPRAFQRLKFVLPRRYVRRQTAVSN